MNLERLWKREAVARRRRLRREKHAEKYRSGEAPLCAERVPGLWWIDGRDGYYIRAGESGQPAFDARTRTVVMLSPATDEQAAEAVIRHGEEEAMWQERLGEIPF